jgi:hypothetical protein
MGRSIAGLLLPGKAAVGCCDDCSKRTNRPTELQVSWRERNAKEMISGSCGALTPLAASIEGSKNYTSRSRHDHATAILNKEAVESTICSGFLSFPFKTTIISPQNHSIRANCPPTKIIRSESNRID